MVYLLLASAIWAFSFGLIKTFLGGLDSSFVAFVRLGLSFLLFLPFLRGAAVPRRRLPTLLLLGGVQYGLMYVTYIFSYRFLAAHQVALFTVFTPLYVTLLNDAQTRRLHLRFLAAAGLAVAGTAVIVSAASDWKAALTGFLIVQAANLCFAVGQVWYRRLKPQLRGVPHYQLFAYLYLGGMLVALAASLCWTDWSSVHVTPAQGAVLLYLGVIPSGLCFFFWNVGATCVNAGTLAVMNNAKVPLAVIAALVVFGERPDPARLLCGGAAIIAAAIYARRQEMLSAQALGGRLSPAAEREDLHGVRACCARSTVIHAPLSMRVHPVVRALTMRSTDVTASTV